VNRPFKSASRKSNSSRKQNKNAIQKQQPIESETDDYLFQQANASSVYPVSIKTATKSTSATKSKDPNEVEKHFFGITVPPRSEERENRTIIHPTSNSFAELEDIQEINYLYAEPEAGQKLKAMNWNAVRDTAAKLKEYAKGNS